MPPVMVTAMVVPGLALKKWMLEMSRKIGTQ
jgi:hypothetical protein